jgi:hypothetical protein
VRAFVIEGPGRAGVREVPDPVAGPGPGPKIQVDPRR